MREILALVLVLFVATSNAFTLTDSVNNLAPTTASYQDSVYAPPTLKARDADLPRFKEEVQVLDGDSTSTVSTTQTQTQTQTGSGPILDDIHLALEGAKEFSQQSPGDQQEYEESIPITGVSDDASVHVLDEKTMRGLAQDSISVDDLTRQDNVPDIKVAVENAAEAGHNSVPDYKNVNIVPMHEGYTPGPLGGPLEAVTTETGNGNGNGDDDDDDDDGESSWTQDALNAFNPVITGPEGYYSGGNAGDAAADTTEKELNLMSGTYDDETQAQLAAMEHSQDNPDLTNGIAADAIAAQTGDDAPPGWPYISGSPGLPVQPNPVDPDARTDPCWPGIPGVPCADETALPTEEPVDPADPLPPKQLSPQEVYQLPQAKAMRDRENAQYMRNFLPPSGLRRMSPDDIEDCVGCQFVWLQVEMDAGRSRFESEIYDIFDKNCADAAETAIFFPACDSMRDNLDDMIQDYMKGYTVNQICEKALICRNGDPLGEGEPAPQLIPFIPGTPKRSQPAANSQKIDPVPWVPKPPTALDALAAAGAMKMINSFTPKPPPPPPPPTQKPARPPRRRLRRRRRRRGGGGGGAANKEAAPAATPAPSTPAPTPTPAAPAPAPTPAPTKPTSIIGKIGGAVKGLFG